MYSIKRLGKEFSLHSPSSTHLHAPNQFPVLIQKSDENLWIVTVPWFWVQPLWLKLSQVKGIKVAGMKQMHQINMESAIPTYPQDFHYLSEGYKLNMANIASMELANSKRPSSQKLALKATEENLGIGSDWFFLRKWIFGLDMLGHVPGKSFHFGEFSDDMKRVVRNSQDLALCIQGTRDSKQNLHIPITEYRRSNSIHEDFVAGTFRPDVSSLPPLPVVHVTLKLTGRGTIKDHARIYSRVKNPTLENLVGFVTSGSFNLSLGHPSGVGLISARGKGSKGVGQEHGVHEVLCCGDFNYIE